MLCAKADIRQIERQLSEHFETVKAKSQSAMDGIANVTNPVTTGFGNATKATSEYLQASTKTITDKMSDDLNDFSRKLRGSEGLCTKCKGFPFESWQTASDVEIVFKTPFERILYHSNWCRLCGYLLRNLCQPGNDPFRHSQVAPHLQDHLEGMTFKQWVDMDKKKSDRYWPFGYGKEKFEGPLNYLNPVAVNQRYEDSAVLVTKHLIPLMMKAAITAHSKGTYTPQQKAKNITSSTKGLAKDRRRGWEKETAVGNLVHPLECFITLTIRTAKDPLRSGQVLACLHGYGRGFGAELARIAEFNLRLQVEPSFGTPEAPLRYGRLLDTKNIDISLAGMWLHDCESNHGTRCSEQSWSSSVQPPPSLRAIDVQNLCIVNIPNLHEIRFVALSYVWGNPGLETLMLSSSNVGKLARKNGLLEFLQWIPTTIKDAIEVTKAIGERYLWVDALCIMQDVDDDEKSHQIAAMDWLYSKAILTIIAADGSNSMDGLHGVRPESRSIKQDSVELGPDIRFLTPIQVPQNLDATVWNARAWTFQERLLSRRLLIFKSGQMTWHCRRAIAHEDMPAADTGSPYKPLRWLTLRKQYLASDGKIDGSIMIFPDQSTHIVRSETFKQYAKLLAQYTHRQMTNDGDILNALGGLLHIFRQFFKFPMKSGLPEILFDIALLWQPAEKLVPRRAGGKSRFPTWSWAGWKGRVRYEEPFHAAVDENLGTLRRVSLTDDEDRREERIRPLIRWHSKHKLSDELRPLNKSGWGVPLFAKRIPEEWDKDPFAAISIDERPMSLDVLDLPSEMLANLDDHHLVFWTTVVDTFQLGTSVSQDSDMIINPKKPPLRYSILNEASKDVGTMLLDGYGPHRLTEKHEFLVIAEAQYYGLDFEPGNIDGYPLYLVMLIEWNETRSAARRLGLGRVDKMDWRAARPKAKIICLE